MASATHCAAHCAQYPKDHAKDDQDDTDCPKDGVTPKKGRDEQADDADGDQLSLQCSGSPSASTLSVCSRSSLLRQPGGFEGPGSVVSEVGPLDWLAIAERPQVPDKSLNLSAARLAAAAEADQHEHLLAGVD